MNTGVGCHALLQRIFLTQGPNPGLSGLLHCQTGSLLLVPLGKLPQKIHIHMYSSRYAYVCTHTYLFKLSLLENNNYKKLCEELKGQWSSRLSSMLLTCIKPLCNTPLNLTNKLDSVCWVSRIHIPHELQGWGIWLRFPGTLPGSIP